MTLIEICVESVDAALVAQQSGADRIELCAGLIGRLRDYSTSVPLKILALKTVSFLHNPTEGGTTPSYGMIGVAVQRLKIPVMVMIRPR